MLPGTVGARPGLGGSLCFRIRSLPLCVQDQHHVGRAVHQVYDHLDGIPLGKCTDLQECPGEGGFPGPHLAENVYEGAECGVYRYLRCDSVRPVLAGLGTGYQLLGCACHGTSR